MTVNYDDEPPLYSEIVSGLYIGGTDYEDTVDRIQKLPVISQRSEFDAVVTCDAYSNPMGWYVKEFRYCFADGEIDAEVYEEIERIADWAFVEWKAGSNVLLRCQAGLNRSSLIAALVLLRDGKSLDDIVALIRAKRSQYALSNPHFMEYLSVWKGNPTKKH